MDDRYAMWERAGMGSLRLGEVLVANGVIESHQLREVLKRHPSSTRMMGELLLDMGAVTPDQLASALDTQDQIRTTREHNPYL